MQQVKDAHGGSFHFKVQGGAEAGNNAVLQMLQQQWRDVGIDAEIETVEQAKNIIEVVTGSYQAVQWQQFDSAGPSNDDVWWLPENALDPPEFTLNFARYHNDTFAAEFARQRLTDDLEVNKSVLANVQKAFGRDVPYVWLWHAQFAIVANKRLVNVTNYRLPDGSKGLDLHMEAHPLYQVWLKR